MLAILVLVTVFTVTPAFAVRPGWVDTTNGRVLYTTEGKRVIGWYQEGNDWYYFNNSGIMARNWFRLTSGIYHASNDGKIDEGWQRFDGVWYYLRSVNIGTEENPEMILRWYYVDGSDELPFGKRELAGSVYKVENTKEPLSGWNEQDNAKEYFNADGTADIGWVRIDGEFYYLDAAARPMRGTKYIDGEFYTLNDTGKLTDPEKAAAVEKKVLARMNAGQAAEQTTPADGTPRMSAAEIGTYIRVLENQINDLGLTLPEFPAKLTQEDYMNQLEQFMWDSGYDI